MPPTPPVSNHSPLPNFNQIDLTPIDSFSLSAGRNQDLPLVPPAALPIGPFPMLPAPTPEVLASLQSAEIPLRRIANKHDVAAMPAITTIRTTPRHMSLPAKRDTPVPTGPALNPDLRLVVHQLWSVVAL
jgi:hypothetical protein